jgi:5-methylcytosine-specific restriction endonuclease McrA
VARGCEFCGRKLPGLKNHGLDACHVVARVNRRDNIIVLCPSCHRAFDKVLKPAVATALRKYNRSRIPTSWPDATEQLLTEAERVGSGRPASGRRHART